MWLKCPRFAVAGGLEPLLSPRWSSASMTTTRALFRPVALIVSPLASRAQGRLGRRWTSSSTAFAIIALMCRLQSGRLMLVYTVNLPSLSCQVWLSVLNWRISGGDACACWTVVRMRLQTRWASPLFVVIIVTKEMYDMWNN